MSIVSLCAQSALVDDGSIYALVESGAGVELVRVRHPSLEVKILHRFHGSTAWLLAKVQDLYLASIDNALLVSRDLIEWRKVLEVKRGNRIRHACTTPEGIVVQEYGTPSTSLYISSNGYSWRHILSNIDVDLYSKHFHYVAHDPYRDVVYATLGDGNLIRAIEIGKGHAWRPIYRGAWQFVPIAVLKDRVVFGFDSGIARGGVGVYYPGEDKWKFIFLKWLNDSVRYAQMSDLVYLDDLEVWAAALGAPQVILVSTDLRTWYLLHIEGFDERFNYRMNVGRGKGFIVCSTGRSLLVFSYDDVHEALRRRTAMAEHRALDVRLKGLFFKLKRRCAAWLSRE